MSGLYFLVGLFLLIVGTGLVFVVSTMMLIFWQSTATRHLSSIIGTTTVPHTSPVSYFQFNRPFNLNDSTQGRQGSHQAVASRDSKGLPVLPPFDPELDPAAVGRSLLTGFLEAMWGM